MIEWTPTVRVEQREFVFSAPTGSASYTHQNPASGITRLYYTPDGGVLKDPHHVLDLCPFGGAHNSTLATPPFSGSLGGPSFPSIESAVLCSFSSEVGKGVLQSLEMDFFISGSFIRTIRSLSPFANANPLLDSAQAIGELLGGWSFFGNVPVSGVAASDYAAIAPRQSNLFALYPDNVFLSSFEGGTFAAYLTARGPLETAAMLVSKIRRIKVSKSYYRSVWSATVSFRPEDVTLSSNPTYAGPAFLSAAGTICNVRTANSDGIPKVAPSYLCLYSSDGELFGTVAIPKRKLLQAGSSLTIEIQLPRFE